MSLAGIELGWGENTPQRKPLEVNRIDLENKVLSDIF
jgi:hypothetical protein